MSDTVERAPSRRRSARWLVTGASLVVVSLWLGTYPLTVYSAGATDPTTCGDAWGALRDELPDACYSTVNWWGWAARIGLVVAVILLGVGAVVWSRNRRA